MAVTRAGVLPEQPQDGQSEDCLARADFPHQPIGLAPLDVELPISRTCSMRSKFLKPTVRSRISRWSSTAVYALPLVLGLTTSFSLLPSRLKASTVRLMAMPGKAIYHQAFKK